MFESTKNKNKPKNYLLLFLLILLGSYLHKVICQRRKLNLLIITSDDLRAADMYPYASDPLKHLPNLDRLANESTVFIADTTYPICNPSRNSLLTGRDFPQVITFDQNFFVLSMQSFLWFLKNNGYYVGMFGKFMHEYTPDLKYQLFQAMNQTSEPRYPLKDGYSDCPDNQLGCQIPLAKSTDQTTIDLALNFLERMHPSNPWVLAVGLYRTHTAMAYNKHHREFYKRSLPNVTQPVIDTNGHKQLAHKIYEGFNGYMVGNKKIINKHRPAVDDIVKSPSLVKKIRGMYLDSLAYVDYSVSLLLNALHRLGFSENTVVIFTADHGFMLSEKNIWGKGALYEESTRIPLFIKVPWLQGANGAISNSRASIIDIFPTIIDLLLGDKYHFKDDSAIPLRGKSLMPALFDVKSKINEYTFFRQGRCQPINESQVNLCVTDDKELCGRPPIVFMGHGVTFMTDNLECRYIAWWPFHEVRIGCKKPTWPSQPISLKDYGRESPQIDLRKSYTDFKTPEQQPELYCHSLYAKYGEDNHPNSNNLAIEPNENNKLLMKQAKKAIINRYSPKF